MHEDYANITACQGNAYIIVIHCYCASWDPNKLLPRCTYDFHVPGLQQIVQIKDWSLPPYKRMFSNQLYRRYSIVCKTEGCQQFPVKYSYYYCVHRHQPTTTMLSFRHSLRRWEWKMTSSLCMCRWWILTPPFATDNSKKKRRKKSRWIKLLQLDLRDSPVGYWPTQINLTQNVWQNHARNWFALKGWKNKQASLPPNRLQKVL